MPVPRTRRAFLTSTVAVVAAGLLASCGAEQPSVAPAAHAAPTVPAPAPQATPADRAPAAPASPAPAAPAAPAAHPAAPPAPPTAQRSGVDRVDVDKAWTNATATSGGQLLVSARSSDRTARLLAYRGDGRLIGEVQNGRGQRYGGTVFAWQATDPGTVTVRSSSGGSATVPTTPWRPEN